MTLELDDPINLGHTQFEIMLFMHRFHQRMICTIREEAAGISTESQQSSSL